MMLIPLSQPSPWELSVGPSSTITSRRAKSGGVMRTRQRTLTLLHLPGQRLPRVRKAMILADPFNSTRRRGRAFRPVRHQFAAAGGQLFGPVSDQ